MNTGDGNTLGTGPAGVASDLGTAVLTDDQLAPSPDETSAGCPCSTGR